jgi:uncharacterized protein YecT (DUF1311 family)
MKKNIISLIFVVFSLFYSQSALPKDALPMIGFWQIIKYQIVSEPRMSDIEIKKWMGAVIEFTEEKLAIRYEGLEQKVCSQFDYHQTFENAQSFFLKRYQLKPQEFGITEEEILVVRMACQVNSWLGKEREFVKQTDEQLLAYWNGVIFFFAKQASNPHEKINQSNTKNSYPKKLLITSKNVGLLNSNSHFNEKTLKEALPGCSVKAKTMIHISKNGDEQVRQYFELFRENQFILKVYPDETLMKIARIHVFDNGAIAPANVKVGAVYAKVFKNDEKNLDCQAGIKKRSGQTVCFFKETPHLQYVFEPTKQGLISPIEALNEAKLVEIIWLADASLKKQTVTAKPEAMKTKTSLTTDNQTSKAPTIDDKGLENNVMKETVGLMPIQQDIETVYKMQEKRLAELYHRIVTALTKKTQSEPGEDKNKIDNLSQFKNAQDAWIAYRDEHCQWQSTLPNSQDFICLEQQTRKRADEIEKNLRQLE